MKIKFISQRKRFFYSTSNIAAVKLLCILHLLSFSYKLLLFLFSGKASFLIRYRCFKGIPEARENSEQPGISFTLYFHSSSCSRSRTTNRLEVSGQLLRLWTYTTLLEGEGFIPRGSLFTRGAYQRGGGGAQNMLVSERR